MTLPRSVLVGLMLRFAMSHPAINTVLIGTTSLKHFAENLASAERGTRGPNANGGRSDG